MHLTSFLPSKNLVFL